MGCWALPVAAGGFGGMGGGGESASVSLEAAPAVFVLGSSTTISATVTGIDGVTPTGSVTFTCGAEFLGTGTLNPGGDATVITGAFALGGHGIIAHYGGDGNYAPAASSIFVIHVTGGAAATVSVTQSARSVLLGNGVTLTATVTGGGATPTGSVNFTTGAVLLGSAALNASGIASLTTGNLGLNWHGIVATYEGDSAYSSATSAVAYVRILAPTGTTLAVTSGGGAVTTVSSGSVVTLTAVVKALGTPLTVGLVNFCDAAAKGCTDIHLVGAAQLTSAGTATVKFVPGNGSHSYKAVFAGTAENVPSASAATALAVAGLYPSATGIAASGSSGNYTLTATVGGNGSTAPTGTVTFLDGSNGNAVLATENLGAGTAGLSFLNSANLAEGQAPCAVATGDFNGDGFPDLAVASECTSGASVYLGNGDGTFTLAPTSGIPGANSLAVGDFNGDGIPDLAVANQLFGEVFPPGTMMVWLGNGDGTFRTTGTNLESGDGPLYQAEIIGVGDFVQGGVPDLAFANQNNRLSVLLGNGADNFKTQGSPWAGYVPLALIAGDFNGDGLSDLAVVDYSTENVNYSQEEVKVLLSKGDGTFAPAPNSPPTGRMPTFIAAGDFNGDGILDLAVTNYGSNTVTVLLGNGDGTFTATTEAGPVAGDNAATIAVGDFNEDGIPDLAITSDPSQQADDGALTILLGNGDGTFTVSATSPATAYGIVDVVAGSFNRDGGLADLVMMGTHGCAQVGCDKSPAAEVLLSVNQTATVTATGVAVPSGHLVLAKYSGDGNYKASTSIAAGTQ
jgi:hypothetical protein